MKKILALATLFLTMVGIGIYLRLGAPASASSTIQDSVLFNNGNIYTVYNDPQAPTRFAVRTATVVTTIQNYHWNYGRGAKPGTISLRASSGYTFGPWSADGSPGQGGVPNAYWTVHPDVRIGPGEYTILDSEPATWSQNSGSGKSGMSMVRGYRFEGPTPTVTPSKPTPTPAKAKIYALTENRAKYKVLIWEAGKEPKTPLDVLNYHLEPGWKGSLPITIPADGRIKFIAGDGSGGPGSMYDKAIASCLWTGDPKNPGRFPHVIFESAGALTCSTAGK